MARAQPFDLFDTTWMLPFGTTCSVPSKARRVVMRSVRSSTLPDTGPAVVWTSITSPTPNWFSSRMKNPDKVSLTRLWAPKPSATPATPALARNGARGTSRVPRTRRTAIAQMITTTAVDRAWARVVARWRFSSWVRLGLPSSLRRNRRTRNRVTMDTTIATTTIAMTLTPLLSNQRSKSSFGAARGGMAFIYADERPGVKAFARLPGHGLLEGPANEHLRQLPPVLRAPERVRRRARALGGSLGRGRGIGSPSESLLHTARAKGPPPHVRQRHGGTGPVTGEGGHPDHGPVLGPTVELQVAPASPRGLRDPDLRQHLVRCQVGLEEAPEEVGGRDGSRLPLRASDDQLGVEGQEDGWHVGGGIRVRARAPDRAEVTDLRVADEARGVRHDRRQLPDHLAVGHVVVPGQGADGDLRAVLAHVPEI